MKSNQILTVGTIVKTNSLESVKLPAFSVIAILEKERVNKVTNEITKFYEICNFGHTNKGSVHNVLKQLVLFQLDVIEIFEQINLNSELTGRRATNPYRKFLNAKTLYTTDANGHLNKSINAKNDVFSTVADRLLKLTKKNNLIRVAPTDPLFTPLLNETVRQIKKCYESGFNIIEQTHKQTVQTEIIDVFCEIVEDQKANNKLLLA